MVDSLLSLRFVMPAQKREARLRARCPGHPRLASKSWMAGQSLAMTTPIMSAILANILQFLQNNNYDKFICYMTSPFEHKPSIERMWFRV
jgi:hypothetical protein